MQQSYCITRSPYNDALQTIGHQSSSAFSLSARQACNGPINEALTTENLASFNQFHSLADQVTALTDFKSQVMFPRVTGGHTAAATDTLDVQR